MRKTDRQTETERETYGQRDRLLEIERKIERLTNRPTERDR